MKLSVLIIIVACLHASATGVAQDRISLSAIEMPLEKVFAIIKKQTSYSFFYADVQLHDAKKVSINVKNATIDEVLAVCFKNQPFDFRIKGKTIFLINKYNRDQSEQILEDKRLINVKGRVLDEKNEPLEGVSVMIKGTSKGTLTNGMGEFSLNAIENNSILLISSINIEPIEIKVANKVFLNINVKAAIKSIDEAIVVAYNKSSIRSNTGSVTIVKGDDINDFPNRSFDRSLQGQVPGLWITYGNGQPGGSISNIILRGIGSGGISGTGGTSRQPLIVIDGIPVSTQNFQSSLLQGSTPITNPLAQINPTDIESYTVLKDASAVALYGSKASNGVILITTKSGKLGKSVFSFRHQTDIANPIANKLEFLDKDEYLEVIKESYKNANPALWTDSAIEADLKAKFPTFVNVNGKSEFYELQNWMDAIYNKNALTSSSELAVSGGTEKARYYFNTSHLSQNGIINNTGYKRTALRSNFSNNPNTWFSFGINSTFSYNVQDYSSTGEGVSDPIGVMYMASPLNPIRLNDGNYNLIPTSFNLGSFSVANPAAALDYNINRVVSYRGLGNAFGEIKMIKNITFKTNFGFDFMLAESKNKIDPRLPISSSVGTGIGQISVQSIRTSRLITTNTLQYSNSPNSLNHLNFIIGQEAQVSSGDFIRILKQGIPLSFLEQADNATTLISGNSSENQKETLVSYFAQANYGYKRKYFVSLSGRRDGSSKFGAKNQFGNYWSIGTGWVLSEEAFYKKLDKGTNYFKIRSSIGTVGNSAGVSPATRFSLLSIGSMFLSNASATLSNSPGNSDIKWEKSLSFDIGIEFRLWKERLVGTIDFYKRNISNLIYTVNLPLTSGFTSIADNIGRMENKGLELSLSADIVKSHFLTWNLGFSWSTNKNILNSANQNLFTSGNLVDSVGQNFDSYYLVRWAGVNPDNGKPLWIDREGDVTPTYSTSNRVIVGKPQPDGFGSINSVINYKNWNLNIFLYYQYGFHIYDNIRFFLLRDGSTYPYINNLKEAKDRWQKPGDIVVSNPRRILNNTDGGSNSSTRYLFRGDFIRLKNVSLSYNFPYAFVKRISMAGIRIYLQGNNLALLTKFPGSDPENTSETGLNAFSYPQARSISLGVELKF